MAKILLRAIRTRSGYPNFDTIRREVEQTIDKTVKPELLSYFTRITKRWRHDVPFRARKRTTRQATTLYVFPTGPNKKLWAWTTGGTRPHVIRPRQAPSLRFKTGYKAKTGRGYRYRGPGRATGPVVFAKRVRHPGTRPREFEKHIRRFYQPRFRRHIENAMRRGARKL